MRVGITRVEFDAAPPRSQSFPDLFIHILYVAKKSVREMRKGLS